MNGPLENLNQQLLGIADSLYDIHNERKELLQWYFCVESDNFCWSLEGEELGLKVRREMIGEEWFKFVFEEAFNVFLCEVDVHRICYLFTHFKVRVYFQILDIYEFTNPDDLFICAHLLEDWMLKIFGYFIFAEWKSIFIGTFKKTIKHLDCLFFWSNIEIVICQPHEKSRFNLHELFFEVCKVQRTENSWDI